MRRLLHACWLLILLLGFYLSSTPVLAAPPSQALTTVTLKLKWQHQFQFAGYYAAVQQSYYRDAGLNVVIEPASNYAEPMDAVLRGEAQFGIGASDLILARARGVPVVALAAIFQHSPLVLIANRTPEITSVHDLANKKLMLEPHSDELLAYLKSEGLSSDQFSITQHNFSPSPLIDGQVDAMSAYITDEPFLLNEAGLEYQIFSPRSAGIDFYGDTLFTTQDIVDNDPEMVKAFLEASLKGWLYAVQHEEEMVDLIYTQYSQRHSRDHLRFEAHETIKLIAPEAVEIGHLNPDRWQGIASTYADLGMLPENYTLNGFLYKAPRPAARWHALVLGSIGVILILLFLLGFAFILKRLLMEVSSLFKRKRTKKPPRPGKP